MYRKILTTRKALRTGNRVGRPALLRSVRRVRITRSYTKRIPSHLRTRAQEWAKHFANHRALYTYAIARAILVDRGMVLNPAQENALRKAFSA